MGYRQRTLLSKKFKTINVILHICTKNDLHDLNLCVLVCTYQMEYFSGDFCFKAGLCVVYSYVLSYCSWKQIFSHKWDKILAAYEGYADHHCAA